MKGYNDILADELNFISMLPEHNQTASHYICAFYGIPMQYS